MIEECIESNTITVSKEEEGVRIDKLLSDRYVAKSRTYFQNLIENGCVLLNGEKTKKRIEAKLGDEIEIFFQASPDISLEPEEIPLDILYEDEHLLAINKPAGMVVHPAPGNWSKTFVNALLFHCKNLADIDNSLRPGIVHRLDKDTSGILLAAKTIETHQKLIESFQKRDIEKEYLTIVLGKNQNAIINAPIGRHPIKRKEMTVLETGKEAITEIKTLAFNEKLSLLLVLPKTGRTHQIRVHLKHLKTPVLGDDLYGNANLNKQYKAARQLLHAYKLKFTHPITQAPMELIAPIPEDFKKFLKLFSKKLEI
ncbi:MAG: RluA family pseudouridine synthase [Chlamydiae bacterium]|nr:RluA family pseudouridine synthase [Chlamydiota bacterium]